MVVLVLAVGFSAFTKTKQMNSDLVWFQVNGTSGQALDATSGGLQGDADPYGCSSGSTKCAAALSISQNEVVNNMDGTFGIASGVDITSSSYYDARDFKP